MSRALRQSDPSILDRVHRRRLEALKRDWEDLAGVDPFWSILTYPEGKHNRWDENAFFETGRRDVAVVLARAEQLGFPARRGCALDVGCGVGRTTRALAPSFATVHGVDVSERLVAAARRLNRDVPSCSFHVSAGRDLQEFPSSSFDLVLSMLVLQHLPDAASIRAYIAEFARVAAPGALIVFQVPQRIPLPHRLQPRRRAYRLLRRAGVPPQTLYRRLGLDPIQVRALAPDRVKTALRDAGSDVLAVDSDDRAGAFTSATYYATPTADVCSATTGRPGHGAGRPAADNRYQAWLLHKPSASPLDPF